MGDFKCFLGLFEGLEEDTKAIQTLSSSFQQVQHILDQNHLLINEINQNHQSRIADNLTRNVGLIKELNTNMRKVVDLYQELSCFCAKSLEESSEVDSDMRSGGKSSGKRIVQPDR